MLENLRTLFIAVITLPFWIFGRGSTKMCPVCDSTRNVVLTHRKGKMRKWYCQKCHSRF